MAASPNRLVLPLVAFLFGVIGLGLAVWWTLAPGPQRAGGGVGGAFALVDQNGQPTTEAALRGGYVDAAEGLLRDRMDRRAGVADGYAQARLMQIGTLRHQAV